MANPAYITDQNVYFDTSVTPCGMLQTSPTKLAIVFDTLDAIGKAHLAALVASSLNVGNTLPLSSFNLVHTFKLDNGSTWWETYGLSVIRVYDKLPFSGPGALQYVYYYDGTDWKRQFDDAAV